MLLSVVMVPQLLSRDARLQVLRAHVDEAARLAAAAVEGDQHARLIAAHVKDEPAPDEATLRQARAGLLRMHRNWPEANYVYTMGVRDGMPFFVLDTAQDAAFAASRRLKASQYGEVFRIRPEYASNWLEELSAGRSYVNEFFQHDDYGYFLSGHAPIRDSSGNLAGFAGVDFDLDYYVSEEARLRRIEITSIVFAVLLSMLLGFGYARYRLTHQTEVRQHVETSMQDPLTGLPNRRGALSSIAAVWAETTTRSHAALLVDIDNFKSINDNNGHATGDDVILALADALRDCLRPRDLAARLGGDEFLLFARDCDQGEAERIAAQLLSRVRESMQAPVRFTVSIGISVTVGPEGGFDQLYRRADAALYRAKGAGRDRFSL